MSVGHSLQYYAELATLPDKEERLALEERIRQAGMTAEIHLEAFRSQIPLAIKYASRFGRLGIREDCDTFLSDCLTDLFIAMADYDPDKGRLSTFTCLVMPRLAITNARKFAYKTVTLTRYLGVVQTALHAVDRDWCASEKAAMNAAEIAETSKVTAAGLQRLMHRRHFSSDVYKEQLHTTAECPEEVESTWDNLSHVLNASVQEMGDKDLRNVLRHSLQGLTLAASGKRLKITREAVRKRRKKAAAQLKKQWQAQGLIEEVQDLFDRFEENYYTSRTPTRVPA